MKAKGKRQKSISSPQCRRDGNPYDSSVLLPFVFCRRARQRITRHILPFAFPPTVGLD
jgi:hypothetical protein